MLLGLTIVELPFYQWCKSQQPQVILVTATENSSKSQQADQARLGITIYVALLCCVFVAALILQFPVLPVLLVMLFRVLLIILVRLRYWLWAFLMLFVSQFCLVQAWANNVTYKAMISNSDVNVIYTGFVWMYFYICFLDFGFLSCVREQFDTSKTNPDTNSPWYIVAGLAIIPFVGFLFPSYEMDRLGNADMRDSYYNVFSIFHTYIDSNQRFMYTLGTWAFILLFIWYAKIFCNSEKTSDNDPILLQWCMRLYAQFRRLSFPIYLVQMFCCYCCGAFSQSIFYWNYLLDKTQTAPLLVRLMTNIWLNFAITWVLTMVSSILLAAVWMRIPWLARAIGAK